jgi:hypothetical protein
MVSIPFVFLLLSVQLSVSLRSIAIEAGKMRMTAKLIAQKEQVADDRVAFTKRNWMGRFLRAEVSYGDCQRIMGNIDSWDQWLPAWADKAQEYERLAEAAEQRGARTTAAEAWRRAAMCWHFGKFNWLDDIDQAVNAQRRLNRCYDLALWSLKPPGTKLAIPYGETTMAAILRRPPGIERPPVVIIMGGLDSVKEELQQVAEYFLDRGMATLSMDGPGQGETGLTLKIEPASEKPVGTAIDFLEQLSDLDTSRLGIYGQSLGGYYVIRAAAFEPRIKAAVASAGLSFPKIISARSDDAALTERVWQQRFHIAGPFDQSARPCAAINAFATDCNRKHTKSGFSADAPRRRSARDPDTRVVACRPDAPHGHFATANPARSVDHGCPWP